MSPVPNYAAEYASESESPSDNEEKNEEERQSFLKKRSRFSKAMLNLLKEFLIMILAVVVYSAVTNDSPRVGKSPSAYPFFKNTTYLTDWYRGEISLAIKQARQSDVSFVMFYAPWSAESQHARVEFESTARYLHNEVTFAAVNCWQPGSECKTQYSKVYRWPILIAYLAHGRGIQYKGPIVAEYMVKFLNNVMFPFVRDTGVIRHLALHDAVIHGKVFSSPYSRDFNVFYQTALRFLEYDPFQEVSIILDTQPLLNENGDENPSQLYVYLWNRTIIYPSRSWKVERLLKWLMGNIEQITDWIVPSGTKSTTLSNYLQPGPTLVLFTPKNPLVPHNDFYTMLKEVSLEYNNCGANWVNLLLLAIKRERRVQYLEFLKQAEECSALNYEINKRVPANLFTNTTYCLENRRPIHSSSDNGMLNYYGGLGGLCVELLKRFENLPQKTDNWDHIKESIYKTSQITDTDRRSGRKVRDYRRRLKCRLLTLAQNYHPLMFSGNLYGTEGTNVTGLGCEASNKTLSFISMDSLIFYHFAERVGLDLSQMENRSAVVILNEKTESQHVMRGPLTAENLRKFIKKFHSYNIKPNSGSINTIESKNTHFYNRAEPEIKTYENEILIEELNHTNFLKTIKQSRKSVIVFYYSKQCSFCNGISNRFLTVARILSSINEIRFARIDGDLNILPWEYTMDKYPTILFVPGDKKSESRVLPQELPITVSNLLGFILLNLEPPLRLEVMYTLCGIPSFYENPSICFGWIRGQILEFIDTTLRDFRTDKRKTKKMVERIGSLNSLYFALIEPDRGVLKKITDLKILY